MSYTTSITLTELLHLLEQDDILIDPLTKDIYDIMDYGNKYYVLECTTQSGKVTPFRNIRITLADEVTEEYKRNMTVIIHDVVHDSKVRLFVVTPDGQIINNYKSLSSFRNYMNSKGLEYYIPEYLDYKTKTINPNYAFIAEEKRKYLQNPEKWLSIWYGRD